MSGDTENTPGAGVDGQSTSGNQEGASSPVGDTALVEQITNLENQVRGLQKALDKRHAETQKKVHEFESGFDRMAAYLKRFDGDVERAKREAQLDDLLAERSGTGQQTSVEGETVADTDSGSNNGVDQETLEFLGFDPNAKDVVRMVRKGFNAQDFIAIAQARGLQRQNQQPNPAAVQSMGEGRHTLASKEDQAVLKQQYERERDELKANRSLNARTFFELKRKYQEKGLPVY